MNHETEESRQKRQGSVPKQAEVEKNPSFYQRLLARQRDDAPLERERGGSSWSGGRWSGRG